MTDQTAILVFANSAQEELKHKDFVKGKALFTALNENVTRIVSHTGLPYFIFSEDSQSGDTFGLRLSNAMQSIYDRGFENVIAIGNDTPHLKSSDLKNTAEKLQNNEVVIGPSQDGGFYLLGLNKSAFNPEIFSNFKWQTKGLCHQMLQHFKASKLIVSVLAVLLDIDDYLSLKAVSGFSKSISKAILKSIAKTLTAKPSRFKSLNLSYFKLYQPVFFNKGSPQLVMYSQTA